MYGTFAQQQKSSPRRPPSAGTAASPSAASPSASSPSPSAPPSQPPAPLDLDPDTSRIASGIVSLIAPAIQELDMRVVAVRSSQAELAKEIERLSAELQLFVTGIDAPPLESALPKLLLARKRLTKVNEVLYNVQARVERLLSIAQTQAKLAALNAQTST
ncbi:hypothetical protein HK102_012769 [Quaeritorhiza haematococci]|nr:hypothetical protein HK102_012769 [Quaeritorhiza haematococci]